MKLGFRSAFSRIIWLQVLALAATSLIMSGAIVFLLSDTAASYQIAVLRQHELALETGLTRRRGGWTLDLPESVRTLYDRGYEGFAFAVLDRSGRVLFSSRAGAAALGPVPGPDRTSTTRFRSPADNGGRYDGASFAVAKGGQALWVQVAQDLQNPDVVMDDVLARFLPEVLWLTGGVLLLLLAVDVLIVRRALTPVRLASRRAEAITPSQLHVRLPPEDMPLEILPLVQAVNRALDRLEQGFRAQRDLTADVAHELRTPLTVLRLRVDALPDPAISQALKADIDLMSRIVSQLLAIAELEQVTIDPADRADLDAVCRAVAEHLGPVAVTQRKHIEVEGNDGPVWVRGQHDFLFQAIRNLVENAIAHTPPGAALVIDVNKAGQVRVLDRGPGVPPEQRELLFRRFWRRGDRAAVGAGAGLGLSIVARIAEAHGGSISIKDRPGGGAAFVLQTPLA